MTPEAIKFLKKSDRVMASLIKCHGPCELDLQPKRSPFEALIRAIGHQQLNGTAAETILGRFRALYPAGKHPTPEQVLATPDDLLRGAGLSRSKIAAIRDLSAKTIEGVVPSRRVIEKWDDSVIIERLVEVRGVGRWTAEMLLIFTLGRPDILPVDDFGVRNGFRVAYGRPEMPKPAELAEFGERWKPHRTTAAWYLWRAADAAKLKKAE